MPRRTELDRPSLRREFTAKMTFSPRASIRKRAAPRGTTATIFPGAKRAARVRVRRNKLTERTRAKAFGLPNREEKPAARITTCSCGTVTQFMGTIVP